eukprot:s4225_g7.t1
MLWSQRSQPDPAIATRGAEGDCCSPILAQPRELAQLVCDLWGLPHRLFHVQDVLYMMSTSPALAFCLILNVSSHLTSDVAHIMILKHISALARTLCDTLKMILMWLLGKCFWFLAILQPLAEPWHPGFLGSWLMIPAIGAVVYGMLMFKNAVYVPLVYAKDDDGEVREELTEEDAAEVEEVVANMDDPFFMEAFRSQKLKKRTYLADSSFPGAAA